MYCTHVNNINELLSFFNWSIVHRTRE